MNAAPRRILLLLLLPIGDTLFSTPTVRALRRSYPNAEITALAYPTNAGILEANPDLDRLVSHPTASTWPGPWAYRRFLWDLRRTGFDLVVEFGPAQGWLRSIIGPRRFRALDFPLWQWFAPLGKRPWRARHAIDSYATLLTPAERRFLPPGPVLHCTAADRAKMGRALAALGAGPIVAVHPGGEGFRGMKRWPVGRFVEVTRNLVDRRGAHVVILGGADEVELAKRYKAGVPEARSLVGLLTLGETVAVLERSAVFLGNDSAPLHMAGALGIPTVGIYGPTNPANFGPRGQNVSVVRSALPCSPCFHFVGSGPVWAGSRCRSPRCLHAVATKSVERAVDRALVRT